MGAATAPATEPELLPTAVAVAVPAAAPAAAAAATVGEPREAGDKNAKEVATAATAHATDDVDLLKSLETALDEALQPGSPLAKAATEALAALPGKEEPKEQGLEAASASAT
eukprot:8974901-Alexandrium_andersonii.AAC.1